VARSSNFTSLVSVLAAPRRLPGRALVACIMLIISSLPALGDPAILDACAECHGTDGMGQGNPMVPVIAGMPAEHIEEAIFAYVDGARQCVREPRMCETVAALSEAEVSELADYFAAESRGPSEEIFDNELAAEGELLHRQHCSSCHLPPDHEDVAYALGIPLHGQRAEYLRYAIEAYFAGDREALLDVMANQIKQLQPGDLGALVHYYASYRSAE
jgi:sulfide dehydrogenase cytochrome subunit